MPMPNAGYNQVFPDGYNGLPLGGQHVHGMGEVMPPGHPAGNVVPVVNGDMLPGAGNRFAYTENRSFQGAEPTRDMMDMAEALIDQGRDHLNDPHLGRIRRWIGAGALFGAGLLTWANGVPVELKQMARDIREDDTRNFFARHAHGMAVDAAARILASPGPDERWRMQWNGWRRLPLAHEENPRHVDQHLRTVRRLGNFARRVAARTIPQPEIIR